MVQRSNAWNILVLVAMALLAESMLVSDPDVFSYDPDDEYGPESWMYLPIENNECGGRRQSGIDIPTRPCENTTSPYIFKPGTCTLDDLTFALSDRNVQTSFPAKGCEAPTMLIPGEIGLAWKVAQIHVHLGSEHALNGTKYVAEIHVVHKAVGRGSGDVSSQQSVLGAFLEVSDSTRTGGFVDGLLRRWEAEAKAVSAACAPMGKNVPTIAKASSDNIPQLRQKSTTRRFDPYHSLLSKNYSLYTYRGSLTTPPCSESVRWNVLAEPVPVSATDLDRLRELILRYVHPATCEPASIASLSQGRPGTTSRPLSPLNGRHVARFCSVA